MISNEDIPIDQRASASTLQAVSVLDRSPIRYSWLPTGSGDNTPPDHGRLGGRLMPDPAGPQPHYRGRKKVTGCPRGGHRDGPWRAASHAAGYRGPSRTGCLCGGRDRPCRVRARNGSPTFEMSGHVRENSGVTSFQNNNTLGSKFQEFRSRVGFENGGLQFPSKQNRDLNKTSRKMHKYATGSEC